MLRNSQVVIVEHGPIKLSTYLTTFRIGDIVDIKANAAQQKGMPHKYYHGSVYALNGMNACATHWTLSLQAHWYHL